MGKVRNFLQEHRNNSLSIFTSYEIRGYLYLPHLPSTLSMPSGRHSSIGTGSSGYLSHRKSDRMSNISRFFTRIARRYQKPAGGPQSPWNPRREAYVRHALERPISQALRTSEGDLRQLAIDLDSREKTRIYGRYGENTASYLAGVYNGHAVQIEPNLDATPIAKPTVYSHATTWDASCKIARIRAMARKDIHMAPLHMTLCQLAYLKPSNRMAHVLTIDGTMAASAGLEFFEIENGVIVARCIDGLIPPCCISGI